MMLAHVLGCHFMMWGDGKKLHTALTFSNDQIPIIIFLHDLNFKLLESQAFFEFVASQHSMNSLFFITAAYILFGIHYHLL